MKNFLMAASIIGMIFLNGCAENKDAAPKEKYGFSPSSSPVSQKLAQTKGLKNTYIVVKKEDGKTILQGKVHTKKQKFLAGTVARSVEGSGRVVNRLAVR
ncbi:MAG: BON domain-containing protein [Sulfurovum sp.]|jgi:outer membrane lipoprotein-sorting protein|nr:BON domain-containing protein [Sulfurovum sp.]